MQLTLIFLRTNDSISDKHEWKWNFQQYLSDCFNCIYIGGSFLGFYEIWTIEAILKKSSLYYQYPNKTDFSMQIAYKAQSSGATTYTEVDFANFLDYAIKINHHYTNTATW